MAFGVTPRFISVFNLARWDCRPSVKLFSPNVIPVMEFPIIMPANGMVYCGLKKFSPTTAHTKYMRTSKPQIPSDALTAILNFQFSFFCVDSTR